MDIDKFTARKMRGLMAERQISRKGLAEALSMTPKTLASRLAGETSFTMTEISLASKILGTDVIFFLPHITDISTQPTKRASIRPKAHHD